MKPLARAVRVLHRSRMDGVEHLPRGAALLVGNHGLLGYESFAFFEQIHDLTGRVAFGLADRWFFKVPVMRDLLVRIGGMYGAPENAERALGRGDWVVCYPGGARETLKRAARDKYKLRWDKSMGFARVAAKMRVPIVPFAAAGVDDTFDILATVRGSGALLMGHDKYDLPVLWGAGPLPRPVPFWFRFGRPIAPCEDREDDVAELHRRVWRGTQALLDDLVRAWTHAAAVRAVAERG